VPAQWLKRDWRGNYRGQKQIWFLLRLVGRGAMCACGFGETGIDAWRWNDYWVPLESVIDFKREGLPTRAHRTRPLSVSRPGPQISPAEIASR